MAAARRKCTIVAEEDEDEAEAEMEAKMAVVRDDSVVLSRQNSLRSRHSEEAHNNLDLALVHGHFSSKPLIPLSSEAAASASEATPAPFPLTSQIGTGLSRQGSLRRSETSGSNSGQGSPSTTPPGSTPSSSQGSPARYKLSTGTRKLANTRSSPQLILNQIHEEAEDGGTPAGSQLSMDPVDNFPQTSAGAAVIRRLEQRRRFKFHKSRTASCSSSDASDDEAAGTASVASAESKRPPRPEKTPTPPPSSHRKDPHDDSSDSNQDPLGGATTSATSTTGITLTLSSRSSRSRSTNEGQQSSSSKQNESKDCNESSTTEANSEVTSKVLQSAPAASRRPHKGQLTRVRQSRSLNRISELHVVADFSENEDLLPFAYLESVSRGQTRSRDDSLTSSDGELEPQVGPQPQRRSKVNLRLLEQRLNKIQEESLNNLKNENENILMDSSRNLETEAAEAAEDGDVSDNVSTVADDFVAPILIPVTKQFIIEDKENQNGETTSVKSMVTNKKQPQPRLNRAHSCGSLFSLKERALLRKKLSSTVTAAFLDILSSAASAKAHGNVNGVVTSEAEVKQKQQDLAAAAQLALKTNPLAVFQLQSTSRCCNLC